MIEHLDIMNSTTEAAYVSDILLLVENFPINKGTKSTLTSKDKKKIP